MIVIDPALSSNYYIDVPRDNVQPIRSQQMSVAYWPFDNLTGWTNISGIGATATISDPGSSDPAIGKVLDLKTNATLGASAGVQRVQSGIQSSFGLLVIVNLTAVGTNPADALTINVQNCCNSVLMARFYDNSVEAFYNGAWHQLIAHGGAYDTEWWIECRAELDGTHTLTLLAGTAVVTQRNGNLPAGAPGNTNLVWVQQFSGATANRRSKVAIMQIGATQLSDPMTLTSKPFLALEPVSTGKLVMLVENVCEDLSGLSADLSVDSGATWEPVMLDNRGRFDSGLLDPFKDVRIMAGSCAFANPGQALLWRVKAAAGSFLPIRRVEIV